MLAVTVNSQAKVYWDTGNDPLTGTYHFFTNSKIISGKKTAYIWNFSHTKRIHKLNNYKYTDWSVYAAKSLKIKGKTQIYYKLSSADNRINGLVYHSFVDRCLVKTPSTFTNNSDYLNYLKNDPSQKLSRQIMQLFPNTPVSLDLSQKVANAYQGEKTIKVDGYSDIAYLGSSNFTWKSDHTRAMGFDLNGYNPVTFLTVTSFRSATPRINVVRKMLDNAGYTEEKRNSMSNYQLGLVIYDNASDAKTYKTDATIIHPVGHILHSTWKIYLAKPNK